MAHLRQYLGSQLSSLLPGGTGSALAARAPVRGTDAKTSAIRTPGQQPTSAPTSRPTGTRTLGALKEPYQDSTALCNALQAASNPNNKKILDNALTELSAGGLVEVLKGQNSQDATGFTPFETALATRNNHKGVNLNK
ncbi:MAG: hypothetical protein LBF34_01625 [Puniceicoccales bacterium]|nr:hypothetical protein [Puniceicoccales bacterium]